jgi:hypothetical protein
MSGRFLEQRINIKFCVKLGKNASDTYAMFSEVYGEEAMKKPCAFEMHKWVKEGREKVEDDEKSGRTRCHRTDEYVEKVWNLVLSHRRLNIRAVLVGLNLYKETVKRAWILT